jgi:hypothetical protein
MSGLKLCSCWSEPKNVISTAQHPLMPTTAEHSITMEKQVDVMFIIAINTVEYVAMSSWCERIIMQRVKSRSSSYARTR